MDALKQRILRGEHQLVLELMQEASTRMPVCLSRQSVHVCLSSVSVLIFIAMFLFVAVYRTGLAHGLRSWRRWCYSPQ